MLESLKIEGFRGFQNFEMTNLGRINLLVGKNNSGKTSILEAILIYLSKFDIGKIQKILALRGELVNIKVSMGFVEIPAFEMNSVFFNKNSQKDNQKIVIYEPDKPASQVILSIQAISS